MPIFGSKMAFNPITEKFVTKECEHCKFRLGGSSGLFEVCFYTWKEESIIKNS